MASPLPVIQTPKVCGSHMCDPYGKNDHATGIFGRAGEKYGLAIVSAAAVRVVGDIPHSGELRQLFH